MQVCPTGALAEKGLAVEEMIKRDRQHHLAGRQARRPSHEKESRLATVWLDGCSGCHMSLLDMDEAILAVAKQSRMVYGPLVDAQEFPKAVDVTLVEGAVSSQDDLEKVRTDPRSAASWWWRWAIAPSPATCPPCATTSR